MAKPSSVLDKLKEAVPAKKPGNTTPSVEAGDGLVIKRSISLYRQDLNKLDEIKSFMAGKGIRNIADSEALRLACRNVKLSDDMLKVFEDMRTEDKRRK
jgi:hypothetical protein